MHRSWSGCVGLRMVTRDGDSVRVVYPGIPAGNFGPDYRDAVLIFGDGGHVTGDVELHLDGDDWHRHGHDVDSAYDRVILHVVAGERGTSARCVAGGRDVPEVVLERALSPLDSSPLPCAHAFNRDESDVCRRLEGAGTARLLTRAAQISDLAGRVAGWEPLAHGVARALGYAANADVSMELGRRLTAIRTRCSGFPSTTTIAGAGPGSGGTVAFAKDGYSPSRF